MSLLEEFAPSLEVYSIDEAFLDLTGVCQKDTIAYGQRIRKSVFRATGIPGLINQKNGLSCYPSETLGISGLQTKY
jgi:impB/mucB/samB family